jgi:hypothetical protein
MTEYSNKQSDLLKLKPCEKCGSNRWKTLVKNKKWMCKNCMNVRMIAE